jgi:hypothetical protein
MNKQPLNFLISALFIGSLLVFYFFDPSEFTFFPSCYFKQFTDFNCPGCGGQRALHDLLHLQFSEAAGHNLLLVAGSPVLGFVAFNAFFLEKKKLFTSKALWVICVVVVTFWLVRNLPIAELAWLRA